MKHFVLKFYHHLVHDMFAWLAELPQWFQMGVAVIIIAAFIFCVIVLVKRGFSVVFGKLRIATDISVKPTKNIHSQCIHVKDVIILLNETNKIIVQKMQIQYYEILKQQMNFAEEKIAVIEGIFLKLMIETLRKKDIYNAIETDIFNGYRVILRVIANDVINKIRISFRENHYNEIVDMDFPEYADQKINYIIMNCSTMMNELYYFKEPVSREEIFKVNMNNIQEIKSHMMEAFINAKKVAIAQQNRIEYLDRALEKLINEWLPG